MAHKSVIKLFDEETGEPHADLFGNGEVIYGHVHRMLEHFEATYGLDQLTCLATASYISDRVRDACWDKHNAINTPAVEQTRPVNESNG